MGASKSRFSIITYDEAEKRMSSKELSRLKNAFNQHAPKGTLSWEKFHSEIFGSFLPTSISELLFKSIKASGNSMITGLSFKEFIIFIIIITNGTFEERSKLIYQIYCNESGTGIEYSSLQFSLDKSTYNTEIKSAREFLNENCLLALDGFLRWIRLHPRFNQLSEWLLCSDQLLSLTDDTEPSDLYSLVAGVTHLSESEIMDLEKTYRRLVINFPNKMDIERFNSLISPPLPSQIVENLFKVFDENDDGNIDFKELACGISACCRGPLIERKKFCCKIFDGKKTGLLDMNDFSVMYEICLKLAVNVKTYETWIEDSSTKFRYIVEKSGLSSGESISIDDLLIWLNDNNFIDPLLNLLHEICTVIFCLKPESKFDELTLLSNWIQREEEYATYFNCLYLLTADWMDQYINILQSSFNMGGAPFKNPSSNNKPANIIHSKSMNNIFAPKRHQYDLHRSSSSKLKSSDVASGAQIAGRYYHHSFISEQTDISEKIFPEIFEYTSSILLKSCTFPNPVDSQLDIRVPPINNNGIIHTNIPKIMNVPSLNEEDEPLLDASIVSLRQHYYLLSEHTWNCLRTWYSGGPSIRRPLYVQCSSNDKGLFTYSNGDLARGNYYEKISDSVSQNLIMFRKRTSTVFLELHLLTLLIMKHVSNTITNSNNMTSNAVKFDTSSFPISTGSFMFSPNSIASINNSTNHVNPIQLRRQIRFRVSISHTMTLADFIAYLAKRLKLTVEEIRVWRVLDENNNLTLLEDDEKSLADLELKMCDKILVEQRNSDLSWPEELSQFAKIKSFHNRKASVNKGVTGLSNIGNTCFFNSALQCVSNATPLTQYFMRDLYLHEINRNNIYGCNGILALRYGELIKDIWRGSTNLIVPIKLKITLEKYAKQFSGHQQHDAQELLSALLDALHEDLNRVRQKPSYKELKDSNGRSDEEVSTEAWQAHLSVNQSIIVDLFHGLLKSNVTCDICQNSSVRFDAFSILSLPIPMDVKEELDILVFPSNQFSSPRKHCLYLSTNEFTVGIVCMELAEQLNVDHKSIFIVLMDYDRVTRFLESSDSLLKNRQYSAYVMDSEYCGDQKDLRFVNLVFYNRKMILKTNYFLAESRRLPELFSYPVVKRICRSQLSDFRNKDVYLAIIQSLDDGTRSDYYKSFNGLFMNGITTNMNGNNILHESFGKLNRAIDCDHLDQHQPFVLKKVDSSGYKCKTCHWSKFCYGCDLNCDLMSYQDSNTNDDVHYFAIDWSIAALHLKYHSDKEHKVIEDNQYRQIKSLASQPLSLSECLQHFVSNESLDKDTPYQCSTCKQLQPAHKKLDLWSLPPILIIHLKRFQYLSSRWQKSNRFVQFPAYDLDLSDFMKNNNQSFSTFAYKELPPNYQLFAVNCHLGSIEMGHYVTYAKNFDSAKWFLFNDSICKEVSEKDVLNNNAYILFYERVGFDTDEIIQLIESLTKSNTNDSKSTEKSENPLLLEADEVLNEDVDPDIRRYCSIQ